MKISICRCLSVLAGVSCLLIAGCQTCGSQGCKGPREGPPYDRPFPLGQVTDAHWETQQTNAEASDFIFYDHEFVGETTKLTPLGERHLEQVALRLCHVPFPVVVEQSVNNKKPALDANRRLAIIEKLTALGLCHVDPRVVVAPAIAEGITAQEGEAAYYTILNGGYGGGGGYGAVGGLYGGYGGARR